MIKSYYYFNLIKIETMQFNQKVTDYIAESTPEQHVILEEVRQLVHTSVENVVEDIKWNMPVFNNGKNFAYMRFAKRHITVGFYNIDKLKDPENLLEGSGNTLRHVKVKTLTPALKNQIGQWLKEISE